MIFLLQQSKIGDESKICTTCRDLGNLSVVHSVPKRTLEIQCYIGLPSKPVKAAWGVGVKKHEHQFSVKTLQTVF